MTMNVLAATSVHTPAKGAGKEKPATPEGVDFAAILDTAPGAPDLGKLLLKARGKARTKEEVDAALAALAVSGKSDLPLAPGGAAVEDPTKPQPTPEAASPDHQDAVVFSAGTPVPRSLPATATTGEESGPVPVTNAIASGPAASTVAPKVGTDQTSDTNVAEPTTDLPGAVTRLLEKLAQANENAAIAKDATTPNAAKPKVPTPGEVKAVPTTPTTPVGPPNAGTKADAASDTASSPSAAPVGTPTVGAAQTATEGRDDRPSDREGREEARAFATTSTNGAPPVPSTAVPSTFTQAVASVAPTGAVGVALNQQFIDMGVSGQWLDSIAQQISAVSAAGGHGRFDVNTPHLGAVRVEMTPGDMGTTVRMTVQNEAAQQALTQDGDRLLRDAQLSSVRIAELRVERASHVAESQRTDTGSNAQQQGQGGNANTAAFASGQNGGQQRGAFAAGQDMGQGAGQNFGQRGVKDTAASTVIRDDGQASPETNGEQRRARYA